MKIDYPMIEVEDIRPGDRILSLEIRGDEEWYREWTFTNFGTLDGDYDHYLIDRPRPKFPDEYGSIIIAKKVRSMYFPGGITLVRLRGSNYEFAHTKPLWKTIDQRVDGKDTHGEAMIEDWVVAKVVPA